MIPKKQLQKTTSAIYVSSLCISALSKGYCLLFSFLSWITLLWMLERFIHLIYLIDLHTRSCLSHACCFPNKASHVPCIMLSHLTTHCCSFWISFWSRHLKEDFHIFCWRWRERERHSQENPTHGGGIAISVLKTLSGSPRM